MKLESVFEALILPLATKTIDGSIKTKILKEKVKKKIVK